MRVSRCPQAAILRCATAAEPARLLSAEGLDIHVWQLGSALDRQNQVSGHGTCVNAHSCRRKLPRAPALRYAEHRRPKHICSASRVRFG